MYNCPLFNTHHAPVGAWASLTFGAPNVGVSFDLQDPAGKNDGLLVAGCADRSGLRSIGFMQMPKNTEQDLTAEGARSKAQQQRALYGMVEESAITRTLTTSKDIYSTGNIRFTTYTPYDALPDPEMGDIPAISCLPGILLEVEVDNTTGTEPCTAFLGVKLKVAKRSYSACENGMLTVSFREDWAFAARESDGVFLTRGGNAIESLQTGDYEVHPNGPAFFCARVPAGEVGKVTVCWIIRF